MTHPLTAKELAKLESLIHDTASPKWRAVCDEVKNARGGSYPPDWWSKIGSRLGGVHVVAGTGDYFTR